MYRCHRPLALHISPLDGTNPYYMYGNRRLGPGEDPFADKEIEE